ncbi:MAG: carbohydrate kinase [Bacteroidales bacterium]|nr:carbohydrate kinase [Bacteroidales bacterium]MCF8456341.1 carbohydrate kinase [Bacteroidales bacterium]
MQFLGLDIGSSSVKASILDGETGICLATASHPKKEFAIDSPKPGWAEQNPGIWWDSVKAVVHELLCSEKVNKNKIAGIGIAYQMHGLVAVDKELNPVRPSIIWCDSRAVETGEKSFQTIGKEKCLGHLLNSPGNFTASKLKWVMDNEPDIFEKIHKIMLPGDYIALKLSGEPTTTISGLSEGMMWNFEEQNIASFLLEEMGISKDLLSDIVPTFGLQGILSQSAAVELGLPKGIPITYRAGDQPNNAFSLNVLNPGEVAATAGTSGVVYGVSDTIKYDPLSRVNTFAHVNHAKKQTRLGVLLCINGTGILNSWALRFIGKKAIGYEEMNRMAGQVPVGSDGLLILPFGNGAERMLENKEIGSSIHNLNFNIHNEAHFYRAAQEGIAFAFFYGLKIMKETGISPNIIRAGHANMFLSDVFAQTLSNISGTPIQLFNTDGSLGAARGAALGVGFYQSPSDCFKNLEVVKTIEPDIKNRNAFLETFSKWEKKLNKCLLINDN